MRREEYEAFIGFLPHPDHLREYANVIPNGAERIMAMAERQAKHRHDVEKKAMALQERELEATIED